MPEPPEPSLVAALLRLEALGRLPRTGWLLAGVPDPESIAAHSLGVAFLVLALGPRVAPPLDVGRAVALAVVHDAPEAVLGDLPREAAELLGAEAKRTAQARAAERVLGPLGAGAHALFEELAEGATREARLVRVCDRLHLGVQLVHHHRAGRRGLEEFEAGLAELDCGGFAPCEELLAALLAALAEGEGRR